MDRSASVATIIALAEEIAKIAPDCQDRALRIADLARDLDECHPDRAAVENAIESRLTGEELSEPQLSSVASRVLDALK